MTTDLTEASTRIHAAEDYLALFGSGSDDAAAQTQHVKTVFRGLARVLHPDRYHDSDDKVVAEAAFVRLHQLYTDALHALELQTYGQTAALAILTTRRAEHRVLNALPTGEVCNCYAALTTVASEKPKRTIVKIAAAATDNDLVQAEAVAIKHLRGPDGDPRCFPFLPELVDSFTYREPSQPARAASVLALLDGFYDLVAVRRAYPDGIDPRDMAWIWRRLLLVLGYAHRMGIVHGAVLPQHIMILPAQHGVVLVDWCYSVRDHGGYPPIPAAAEAYRTWYPNEVRLKRSPNAATDIFMAARCMVWLLAGDPLTGSMPPAVPRAFRAFLNGCLAAGQAARPDDAWKLLGEFDALLQAMGTPYFPRRFHVFTMPE